MKVLSPPCWLSCEDLGRFRVGAEGLLLGRSPDCDLVLPDPRTSRHHALVREGLSGPLLIPLGRNPTLVNGARVSQVMPLQSGDLLGFPGLTLEVVVSACTRPTGRTWTAIRERGTVMAALRGPLNVGGGDGDDLIVPGWPPAAAHLDVVGRSLIATFKQPGTIDGAEQEAGAVVQLTSGCLLAFGEERLRVLMQRDHSQSTVLIQETEEYTPLESVRCSPLGEKGAVLELVFDDLEVSVELSELRARLVRALVLAGGEAVDDEALLPEVYPPPQRRTSRDLELLVQRLRSALIQEGVDPYRVLERRGSRTRLLVDPGTRLSAG
jgi:hypothetical protein